MPRFSIVIPAFNAEAFLGNTICSVLAQTDPDFELIIVDDGSTDRTAAITTAFEDPRIRAISVTASGRPAVPRNLGVQFATGEFVAFLDADDSWPANKLATFRAAIDRNPDAGLFFSNGFVTDPAGTLLHRILPESNLPERIPAGSELLLLLNYIPLSSAVVRRDLLGDNPFDECADLRAVEDYLLWLRLNQVTTLHYLPQPLLYKRTHSANISADRSRQLLRIHSLLDTIDALGTYPGDLISLARILYDARYQPTFKTRWRLVLEITAALIEHPVRTVRRLSGLFRLSRPRTRPVEKTLYHQPGKKIDCLAPRA